MAKKSKLEAGQSEALALREQYIAAGLKADNELVVDLDDLLKKCAKSLKKI